MSLLAPAGVSSFHSLGRRRAHSELWAGRLRFPRPQASLEPSALQKGSTLQRVRPISLGAPEPAASPLALAGPRPRPPATPGARPAAASPREGRGAGGPRRRRWRSGRGARQAGRPAGRGRRGAPGSPAFSPRRRRAAILRSCLRWRRRLSSPAAQRSHHRLSLPAATAPPRSAPATRRRAEVARSSGKPRRPPFPHSPLPVPPETLRWRREVAGPALPGRGAAARAWRASARAPLVEAPPW